MGLFTSFAESKTAQKIPTLKRIDFGLERKSSNEVM